MKRNPFVRVGNVFNYVDYEGEYELLIRDVDWWAGSITYEYSTAYTPEVCIRPASIWYFRRGGPLKFTRAASVNI